MNNAAMNISCTSCVWTSFSFEYIPKVELLRHMLTIRFNLLRKYQSVFPKWLHRFILSLAMDEGYNFSTFL